MDVQLKGGNAIIFISCVIGLSQSAVLRTWKSHVLTELAYLRSCVFIILIHGLVQLSLICNLAT